MGVAHTEYLRESLLATLENVNVYGGIPKDANAQAADNASGDSLEQKIEHMAMLLEQNVDLDALLDAMPTYEVPPRIARELAMERADRTKEAGTSKSPTRIAIARDEAFCFYYPENLTKLEEIAATKM